MDRIGDAAEPLVELADLLIDIRAGTFRGGPSGLRCGKLLSERAALLQVRCRWITSRKTILPSDIWLINICTIAARATWLF